MLTIGKFNRLLFDEAGDADGGGGLTDNPDGGEPNGGEGNNNPGGEPAGGEGAKSFELPENWKDGLPEDIKAEGCLETVRDFEGLVKSFVHAQKAVGRDKIPLPGPHATEDDWKAVYNKLGLPESVEEYELNTPEGVEIDDDFIKGFKEQAHKNGVLPKQAEGLMNWYLEHTKGLMEGQQQETAQQKADNLKKLQTEWGEAYSNKMKRAQIALREIAGENKDEMNALFEALDKTGMSTNPAMIKAFDKVADLLSEDTFKGEAEKTFGVKSPAEAQREIDQIMANPEHPYFNEVHPNHQKAVEDVGKLFDLTITT